MKSPIEEIEAAFDGVERPKEVTLHVAEEHDNRDYDNDALHRAKDFEGRWQDVPAEHLLKCHCGLTHLHEDGLPFYLPAAMTWVLKNFRDTNEMLTDSTIYQLEKKGLCDHYDWRFRLFTLAQWRACRSFLEYLLHEDRDRNWIDSDVAKLALDTVKAKIQALTIVAPEKPATGFESP
jgi:hypothetical protein